MLYAGRSAISSLPEAAWGDDLAGSGGLSPRMPIMCSTGHQEALWSRASQVISSQVISRGRRPALRHKIVASLSSSVFAAFGSELSKPSV
jgi:hypothetical protein